MSKKIRPSTLLMDCVDKVTPNRLGVGVKLELPALLSPYYQITSPGGFTPVEAALIEAEAKRMGLEIDMKVACERRVYCGYCGVALASSYVDCADPPRLQVIHACLGTMHYALSRKPNEWEMPVFAYTSRLAYIKDAGPENERGVVCGLPRDHN